MSINLFDFKPGSLDESTDEFSKLSPFGKGFDGRWEGTNFRAFLKGLAGNTQRAKYDIFSLASQYIPQFDASAPNGGTSIVEEWEQDLGIPDDCFLENDYTLEERRRNIIIKLSFMNLQTQQDYIDLAEILGLEIFFTYGAETQVFTYTFPFIMGDEDAIAATVFINIVDSPSEDAFPYTFPLQFGDKATRLFECIVNKQKPAHINYIFNYVSEPDEFTFNFPFEFG